MANKLYIGNSVLVDLSNYYTKSEVDTAISNVDVSDQLDDYVQKDGSKVLSDNNFTDALKTKLEGLSNFDPTNINSAISAIQSTLGDITGDGAAVTAALDTWNEIKAFVSDYTNTGDLQDLINTTTSNIQTWVGNQGYLTSTAAASTYQPLIEGDPVVYVNGVDLSNGDSNVDGVGSVGGGQVTVDADCAFAFGNSLSVYNPLTFAIGHNADIDSGSSTYGTDTNSLFVVGNGFDNLKLTELNYNAIVDPEGAEEAPHTAFDIKQSGKIYVANTGATGAFYEKPMVCLQTELAKATNSIQNTGGVTAIVKISQSDFNALATKDSGTLYIVEDNAQAGS